MSVKCLCKIGILQPEDKNVENATTIQFKGKLFDPLIECDFEQLTSDITKNRDFCLVGLKSNDTEYCTIFHDGTRTHGRHNRDSRMRILSLIFPEFKLSCSSHETYDDETEEDKVAMMNYVTTKLYHLLRNTHMSIEPEEQAPKHERLLPTLRKYQEKTIQWLLRRERESVELQHFYEKFQSTEGYQCYVNLIGLDIKDELPENIPIPSGGILADEMGLGKTVEVLALILLNGRKLPQTDSDIAPPKGPPSKKFRKDSKLFCVCRSTTIKKKNMIVCTKCTLFQHEKCVSSYIKYPFDGENYICPKCWESLGILEPSAATVIVSPNPIKLQWLSEMQTHIDPPPKVLLYDGASKQKWSPKELANYDIILTDYNILRKEIHFTALNETNISFRRERQVMRVNSPLMLVEWWRVCLDEAQMESANTNASKIVKQLPAIHRWAVTGTPIQRSLDDLAAILEFVGLYEVSSHAAWQHLTTEFIQGRSEKLVSVLEKIMWRTCKSVVLDELGIPPQSEIVHFVELNNVEELFYSDEHANCAISFHEKIQDYSDLSGISPKILKIILQPMLKLRQDCTTPVLRLRSEQNVVKKFLQPQELLDHLKSSNELECKNELRTMASCHNGIAAVFFLQENYDEAIKYYELVLKLAKQYQGAFSVDSLLQIHALHNMIQAHRMNSEKDPPDLAEYETQCNTLEWKYFEPYAQNLQSAHNGYSSAMEALKQSEEKTPKDSAKFWASILDDIDLDGFDSQLLNKINDDLFVSHRMRMHDRFRSVHSMTLVLNVWYEKIMKIRKELSKKFSEFDFFIQNVRPRSDVPIGMWRMTMAFVRSVYDCHLSEFRNEKMKKNARKQDKDEEKKVCQLCIVQRELQNYECLIFDKVLDKTSSNAEGTWNPTMQETILKEIFSFIKTKPEFSLLVKDCEAQLEIINLLKTEYKELVKLWIEIEYTVKAYDEMDMCKMRISWAQNDEEKTKYQILSCETEALLAELQMNFNDAQKKFILKHARLKYLRHLAENTDPGPCPICAAEEQHKYVVLECGHHMCLMCIKTLLKMHKSGYLHCAICRNQQLFQSVHYVTRKRASSDTDFVVIGDYSSKIEKIVIEVLKLRTVDEKVKILIFSQWQPILKAISDALHENSIQFKLKWSPQSIQQFKTDPNITCMLMLLHNGSHGLNIVEATHVFLVEPILNPGEELQAIGRVHRIGQTKPTTVHRFIVRNTIEENIYNAVSKDKTNKWSNLTIDTIKKLFELLPTNSLT